MKSFLILFGLSLSLSFATAQTEVDLSISATAVTTYDPMTSSVDVEVCVTNNSTANNLSGVATGVQNVVVVFPESRPVSTSFPAFAVSGMGVTTGNNPPSIPIDDVVIITGSTSNFSNSPKNSTSNCEEIRANEGFGYAVYTIPSIAASSQECFTVTVTVDPNFIGCGLALIAEIYSAQDQMGNPIVDSDSPYDSYDCPSCCCSANYVKLDDNDDGLLDTDDNVAAVTFDVCQFPEQEQCVYIPPGDWELSFTGQPQVFNVSGPQRYVLPDNLRGMMLNATISDGRMCSSNFVINTSTSFFCNPLSNPILPIELTFFTGKAIDGNIQLHWRTETEQNNAHMIVERSADGEKFVAIGRVKGAGTTVEPQEYTFVDKRPNWGTNYYRLRQVDTDGTEHLHEVIQVQLSAKTQQLKVVPTLVNETMNLQMAKPLAQAGQVVILTLTGKIIWTGILPEQAQQFGISTTHLPAGTYFVQVRGQRIHTARFVKE